MIPKARRESRLAGATVLPVLFAVVSAACNPHRVDESMREELRLDAGERTAVEIRVDDGRVTVAGGAAGAVEVVFTKHARAADTAGATALLESIRTEARRDDDVIRVSARSFEHDSSIFGGDVWTDIELRVPRETADLDIRTDDGRITVEAVSGSIVAESGDGRIRVANVNGDVRLRTRDGSITGTDVDGDIDVLTEDGRIRLDGSFGRLRAITGDGSIRIVCREGSTISADWTVRTSDGSIELTLPENVNAELEATSADDRIVNDLSRFEGTERDHRVEGRVGRGGPSIFIATMDGRIVLREP